MGAPQSDCETWLLTSNLHPSGEQAPLLFDRFGLVEDVVA